MAEVGDARRSVTVHRRSDVARKDGLEKAQERHAVFAGGVLKVSKRLNVKPTLAWNVGPPRSRDWPSFTATRGPPLFEAKRVMIASCSWRLEKKVPVASPGAAK